MNEQQQSYFFNAINLLSLALGIENLQENRQQSAQNNVQAANAQQAEYLLQELGRRFDEQNAILKRLLDAIEKLSGGEYGSQTDG